MASMDTVDMSLTYLKMSCDSLGAYQEVHQSWMCRLSGKKVNSLIMTSGAIVEHALTWLIENNIYYQANQVHINHVAVAQLPQDGDLSTLTSVNPDPPSMEQRTQRRPVWSAFHAVVRS